MSLRELAGLMRRADCATVALAHTCADMFRHCTRDELRLFMRWHSDVDGVMSRTDQVRAIKTGQWRIEAERIAQTRRPRKAVRRGV